MATNKQLQAQLEELRKLLAQHGITDVVQPAIDPTERADYIAFGSLEYRDYLGLVEVEDVDKARADGYILHASPVTGKVYRLADELGASVHYPGLDLDKAALAVLRQKVSTFESGPPEVPEDALPMWVPRDYVLA